MRAVLTRVKSASVTVDGKVIGKIGPGFSSSWASPMRILRPRP